MGLVLIRMFPGGMGFPSLRITIRDIAFGDLRGTFAVKMTGVNLLVIITMEFIRIFFL